MFISLNDRILKPSATWLKLLFIFKQWHLAINIAQGVPQWQRRCMHEASVVTLVGARNPTAGAQANALNNLVKHRMTSAWHGIAVNSKQGVWSTTPIEWY